MSKTFDFSYFPVLETPRLVLRELSLEDTAAVFRIRGDYDVTKYNIGPAYARAEQAASMIESVHYGFREGTELRWGIVPKAGEPLVDPEHAGEVIGVCGYNYWDRRDHRGSIGYDLARAYWGRGYMPEALTAIIHFGFDQMGLNRIEADASIYNTASTRVLEKLGFIREGIQREQYFEDGGYHDLCLFGLIKRDWEQK
jgi:[ribosomal protein S5]-alanine N-acetyltransferase